MSVNQEDVDKLVELYFKQPNVLVDHLFGSYHQFVEEIIPYVLSRKTNYFYENVITVLSVNWMVVFLKKNLQKRVL